MADNLTFLGFAGSLREKSHNRALLRAAEQLLPHDAALETFDLSAIPLYNADLEEQGWPEPVRLFRERIAAADALLVVTPEYNWSIPGVLKNAIDWASRPPDSPLNDKPAAVMGASTGPFGTTRAQLHLRQVFAYTNTLLLSKPFVLIPKAQEKIDTEGNLTDEATREQVSSLLAALADWTRRLQKD
jgi:chromate reductase